MDRFVEIDCDVFGSPPRVDQVKTVLARLKPILSSSREGSEVGLVINFGWVMDLVTLWSGDPLQKLPIQSHRLAGWSGITYRDLCDLILKIRETAEDLQIPSLRIGPLFIGVGEFATDIVNGSEDLEQDEDSGAIYQERSAWLRAHPEIFPFSERITLHGKGIDLRVALTSDSAEYASFPEGIPNGTTFAEFFARQWESLSNYVGFSLLLLRDEFTTPVHAGRIDFDGGTSPASAMEIQEWTDAVATLTNAIKASSSSTWLMLYSSGLSPSVDYHYGRLDTQRLVQRGSFDAWIEQTWGGAWQDWWDAGFAGWTFQLTNLCSRLGLIKSASRPFALQGPRVYKLIQLLDGWEPYDTFRDYKGKLKWGIWAFSQANYRDESGRLHHTDGSYFAIANDNQQELITLEEAKWVANEVSLAEEAAERKTEQIGFVLPLQNSEAKHHSPPVFIEEAISLLAKWGFMFAGTASAGEHLLEMSIVAPSNSIHKARQRLLVGRPEDLSEEMKTKLEIKERSGTEPAGFKTSTTKFKGLRTKFWPYLYSHRVTSSALAVMSTKNSPLIVNKGLDLLLFPPDLANPLDRRVTHYQLGAIEPFVGASRLLQDLAAQASMPMIGPVATHEPTSLMVWLDPDELLILLGNVESGWMGDSRFPRIARITLPPALSQFSVLSDASHPATLAIKPDGCVEIETSVPPENMALVRVRKI